MSKTESLGEWTNRQLTKEEQPGFVQMVPIESVEVTTAGEVYQGKSAGDPSQKVAQVFVLRENAQGKSSRVKVATIPIPENTSEIDPRSHAGRYTAKYHKPPAKGDMVNVRTNAQGFWELVF